MNFDDLFLDCRLPDPLSDEEIKHYLKQYKLGDENAKDIVIMHNIRSVIDLVKTKFASSPYEKAELVSAGLVGLVNSVDYFNPMLETKYVTFATACAKNEILMYMKKNKRHLANDSLDRMLSSRSDDKDGKLADTIEDVTIDITGQVEETEIVSLIKEVIVSLPERDKKIMNLHFDMGYNQNQISEMINLSCTQVSKIIKKNIINIKRHLMKIGMLERSKTLNSTEDNHIKKL